MGHRNMPLLIMIALMAAVAAAAYYYQTRHPREIVGTGDIVIERQGPPLARQTLKTRTVKIASTTFQEVALPNGTWIGCEGDCRGAARGALDKFWDEQDQRRK
jgi:uncharacterized protein YhfF